MSQSSAAISSDAVQEFVSKASFAPVSRLIFSSQIFMNLPSPCKCPESIASFIFAISEPSKNILLNGIFIVQNFAEYHTSPRRIQRKNFAHLNIFKKNQKKNASIKIDIKNNFAYS